MLDITIIAIGKIKNSSQAELAAEYWKRLKPYARLKLVELPATSFTQTNKEKSLVEEGDRITDYLAGRTEAQIFLMAERGQLMSSPELASWLEKSSPLVLVVGGALGFSRAVYDKYPAISLSPLTFPHEMARVVLLEQIYRATTILNKKDYHY
jgi:23S rRNA (pseudouridine1915-N3)-methyltransferase